eukprot:767933-Hanusia_phi.AAC.4
MTSVVPCTPVHIASEVRDLRGFGINSRGGRREKSYSSGDQRLGRQLEIRRRQVIEEGSAIAFQLCF